MPTDPNQPPQTHGSAPGPRSWFYDPDSADIHVFRPSGLWNLTRFTPTAAPAEPILLRPPELLRHPHDVVNATLPSDTAEPDFTLLEGPILVYRNTPPVQRFVLIPDPTARSPTLLTLETDHSREALYQAAMQGLATQSNDMGGTLSLGRPASTDPRTCTVPLPLEESAFALAEAPTPCIPAQEELPPAEQEVNVALLGASSSAPYADH